MNGFPWLDAAKSSGFERIATDTGGSLAKELAQFDGDKLRTLLVAWGWRVVFALLILLIGWWISRWIAGGLRRVLGRAGADPLLGEFLRNIALVLLFAIVVIGALERLGIPTTSLIAALGAIGLALGLALQNSLSNLAAGILLMLLRPFRVGDYVEVAGLGGTVQRINLMQTTLLTADNREIILPNAKVAAEPLVNANARPTRRLDLQVSISYQDDIGKAIALIRSLLQADSRVLVQPEPVVAVLDLADSSVDLAVRPWVRSEDYWPLRFDLQRAIKERFDAEGITIPSSQREFILRRESDS